MTKTIYTAPFRDRLLDLRETTDAVLVMIKAGMIREYSDAERQEEGLRPGEFAIGNWIVRPRFAEDGERAP